MIDGMGFGCIAQYVMEVCQANVQCQCSWYTIQSTEFAMSTIRRDINIQ